MEFFHQRTHIDFIGNRYKFFAVSGIITILSVVVLAVRGLNYGIEFTGGNVTQITYEKPVAIHEVRLDAEKTASKDAGIQQFTGTNTFTIRIKGEGEGSAESVDKFLAELQAARPDNKFRIDQKDYVGPAVGKHLFRQALLAIVLSLLGIVVYVAFRFNNLVWGLAGVLSLVHDVLFLFAFYSFMRSEFNLTLVAAILTLAGYSINDTIVVFDRMREKMRIYRKENLGQVINQSMNETLSRTVITVLTVLIAVVALYIFGGPVIHDFAMGMTWGTILGCYSSVAIAAPLVYQFEVGHGERAAEGSAPAAGDLPPAPSPSEAPKGPQSSRAERRRRNK
ncbi:MAG: protein translocase subunit SecF [Elusimicrobiota bacterium]|jgi:preprotein translocase subunit SecF